MSRSINRVVFYFPFTNSNSIDALTCAKYREEVHFIEIEKDEIRYCLKEDDSLFYIKILDIEIVYIEKKMEFDINFTIQYVDGEGMLKMRCFELMQLLYNIKAHNVLPSISCYFLIPTFNSTTKRELVCIEPSTLGNTIYDTTTKKTYKSNKYFDWIFFSLKEAKEGAAKLFPDRLSFQSYNLDSNYYK